MAARRPVRRARPGRLPRRRAGGTPAGRTAPDRRAATTARPPAVHLRRRTRHGDDLRIAGPRSAYRATIGRLASRLAGRHPQPARLPGPRLPSCARPSRTATTRSASSRSRTVIGPCGAPRCLDGKQIELVVDQQTGHRDLVLPQRRGDLHRRRRWASPPPAGDLPSTCRRGPRGTTIDHQTYAYAASPAAAAGPPATSRWSGPGAGRFRPQGGRHRRAQGRRRAWLTWPDPPLRPAAGRAPDRSSPCFTRGG